ncbi:hypothetical protein BDR03DRAFT_1089594 [Suillus americanus]|nr:hypothetical protein BDR03DRAFT_1089594 [Suillus americanus]
MVTDDQALFSRLNLGNINSKDEPLRGSLGCSPDEVQVDSGDGLGENKFIACLRIRKFQKRLLITENVGVEFVAGRRIWLFLFLMKHDERWHADLSLAEPSLPARPGGRIRIEAHRGKSSYAAPPSALNLTYSVDAAMLVPAGTGKIYKGEVKGTCTGNDWLMTDWLADK